MLVEGKNNTNMKRNEYSAGVASNCYTQWNRNEVWNEKKKLCWLLRTEKKIVFLAACFFFFFQTEEVLNCFLLGCSKAKWPNGGKRRKIGEKKIKISFI